MLEIIPINAFTDNYIWCLVDRNSQQCVVVDPGEAKPVLAELSSQALNLSAILLTHHHWDHVNGVKELLEHFDVPVYGPALEPVKSMSNSLKDGDILTLDNLALTLNITHIPGHTLGHIAYHNDRFLFSGDTLFTGGCGKIFEGTVEQMYHSLSTLASLDENILIYCGHEYTESNLRFAQLLEPNNADIQQRIIDVAKLRADNSPTVPASLAIEKKTNPFLRCTQTAVITAAENYTGSTLATPQEVLAVIREWKNKGF